jgi:membrane protein YqaA with SNARE-associated domain
LSWVPLVGDALVALAGAARMPFAPFSIWTLAGKAARYAVLGWAVD